MGSRTHGIRTLKVGITEEDRQEELGKRVGRAWPQIDQDRQDKIIASLDLPERLELLFWIQNDIRRKRLVNGE